MCMVCTGDPHIETNGHSLSFGRFDQYMNPFLQKDLKEGRITMERGRRNVGSTST